MKSGRPENKGASGRLLIKLTVVDISKILAGDIIIDEESEVSIDPFDPWFPGLNKTEPVPSKGTRATRRWPEEGDKDQAGPEPTPIQMGQPAKWEYVVYDLGDHYHQLDAEKIFDRYGSLGYELVSAGHVQSWQRLILKRRV